jgi:pyrroline-5-carboxylate reductase
MSAPLTLGFLGSGKMATALAQGFVKAGLVQPQQILGSDPAETARDAFAQATGGRSVSHNRDLPDSTPVLFIAVKPHQVASVLQELSPQLTSGHLLISIAAGVTLKRLQEPVGTDVRVVRAMPNTPALVGAAAVGYALGSAATEDDATTVQQLFSAVGVAFQVKEALLDAVTGLSGSGPAYVYQIIEALSDGGVASGLPRDIATRLAAQTLLGSARMVLETNTHPAELKDMVTSPGGTTIEGLQALETGGVRAALIQAVRAAAAKARQLNS